MSTELIPALKHILAECIPGEDVKTLAQLNVAAAQLIPLYLQNWTPGWNSCSTPVVVRQWENLYKSRKTRLQVRQHGRANPRAKTSVDSCITCLTSPRNVRIHAEEDVKTAARLSLEGAEPVPPDFQNRSLTWTSR